MREGGSIQNEPFYGMRKALVVVGLGDCTCPPLYLIARITHGNAEARALEHQDIVGLVTDRCDLRSRYSEGPREVVSNEALVCIVVRDVEVVRLRASRGGVLADACPDIGFAALDEVVVVTDADDLHDLIQSAVKVLDDFRWKLDRPRLAIDMRCLGIAHQPVIAGIDPDIEPVA